MHGQIDDPDVRLLVDNVEPMHQQPCKTAPVVGSDSLLHLIDGLLDTIEWASNFDHRTVAFLWPLSPGLARHKRGHLRS